MSVRPLALVRGALLPGAEGGPDSLLLQEGRIARVASAAEVLAAAPDDAEVVDLRGRAVSAGFHDAHFHLLQTGIKAQHPGLRECRSLDDVYDSVLAAHRARPGKGLLVFEEWDETTWDRAEPPTRAGLDAVVPDRPVLLRRIDDHIGVANRAGVDRLLGAWKGPGIDPETGVCREDPVLLLEELFPPDAEETAQAFEAVSSRCFALGITTAADFLRPFACAIYAERFDSVPVTPHVDAFVWADCLGDSALTESLPRSGAFRWRGIKAWADGSIGARQAALFDDYTDRPGERGRLMYTDEELRRIVHSGHHAGLATAVHAIGDRAIAQVVDAFATLPPEEIAERRHRIEHFELPRAGDIDRVAALGVRPCVQPNFVGNWARPGGLYEVALGRERLQRMNPLRTLLDRGTGVFFGSDGMPPSPRFGIRSAMEHPVQAQRLTLEEAHRLYTEEAALAVAGRTDSARLCEGAPADVVVLPVPPERIAQDQGDEVDLTVLGGRIVHRRVPLEDGRERC